MSAMTYKEKRELRRAAMAPQLADIIEGFIVGSCFLYLVVGIFYWWITGEMLVNGKTMLSLRVQTYPEYHLQSLQYRYWKGGYSM